MKLLVFSTAAIIVLSALFFNGSALAQIANEQVPRPIASSNLFSSAAAMDVVSVGDQSDSLPTIDSIETGIDTPLVLTNTEIFSNESSSKTKAESNTASIYASASITESASDSKSADGSDLSDTEKSSSKRIIGIAVGVSAGILLIIFGALMFLVLRAYRRRRRMINTVSTLAKENDMDDIYAIGGADEPLSPEDLTNSAANGLPEQIAESSSTQVRHSRLVDTHRIDLFELPPEYNDLPDANISRGKRFKSTKREKN